MDHQLKQDVTEKRPGVHLTHVQGTDTEETDSAVNANRGSWSIAFSDLSLCKYSPVAGKRTRGGAKVNQKLSQLVTETTERIGEIQQVRAGMLYLSGPLKGGKAQLQP